MTTQTATQNYSLRRVKTFRGREGTGLSAELLRDDKVVSFITDEGNGGMVWFDWADRMHGESSEEAMFSAFVEATLPPDPRHKGAASTQGAETLKAFAMERWVNKKVDDMLNDKRWKRMCKTNVVYQIGAQIGSEEFWKVKGGAEQIAHLRQKYAGQKLRILNDEFKD